MKKNPSELARVKIVLCFAIGIPLFLQAMLLVDGSQRIALEAARALQLLAIAISLSGLCSLPFLRYLSSDEGDDAEPRRGRDFQPGRATLVALVAWASVSWLQLWIVSWLRPVYDWDGLYYHVPAIHGWLRSGYVSWVDAGADLPFVNGYPMAVESLGFFVTTVLGHDRLLDAGNLLYWPIGILSIYIIARRLGASAHWSVASAAALAGSPLFVAASTTAYVDVAFACAVMAMLAAAVEWVEERGFANALLFGLAGGLAMASKGFGLPFFLIVIASSAIFALLLPLGRSRARLSAELAAGAALALLLGGGWFVRNLSQTGNPLHPIGLEIAGFTLIPGIDGRAYAMSNMPHWLLDFPVLLRPLISWTQPEAPITHYAATSGLGFVWLVAGMPAALALFLAGLRERKFALGFLFLFLTSLCMLAWQPAGWWARLTLWLHALGLPCMAIVMTRGWKSAKGLQRVLLTTLCTALFFTAMTESVLAVRHQWEDGLLDPAELSYLSNADYLYPGIESTEGFDEMLRSPRIARGPWSPWGTLLGGVLATPAGQRDIRALSAEPTGHTVRELRREGFVYVLWDVRGAGPCPPSIRAAYALAGSFTSGEDLRLEVWKSRPGLDPSRAR